MVAKARKWAALRSQPQRSRRPAGPNHDVVEASAMTPRPCRPRSGLTGSRPPDPLSHRSPVHGVDRTTRPVELVSGSDPLEDQAVEIDPHSGFRPLREASMSCGSRRTEGRGRQLLPCTARRRHEHDRGQHFPVTVAPTPTTLRPRRNLWHHALKQFPQVIRHQSLNDPHHDEQPIEPAG